MAKFTSTRPLNFQWGGYRIVGAAGATYRIDDGMKQTFEDEFGDRVPIDWIVQDESTAYGGGGGGAHPDLATHEALGLADAIHAHEQSAVANLATDLAAKAASVHTHPESSVTNLVTDLAGKAASVHSHAESSVTNLVADLAAKAATIHTHAESDTTSLVSDLAGKAATVHTHAQSSITNLVSDLAGKAASSHSHVDGDLPASIARDTEVTAAIANHDATATHGSGGGGCPFRVGDILTSRSSVSPDVSWPGTTWAAYGSGRIVVSLNTADGSFQSIDQTGGAKTHAHADHTGVINHTHVVDVTDPGHAHVQGVNSATTGGTSGYTPDTSTNTRVNSGYSTSSATTGVTASTQNPSGGVSALSHQSVGHMPPYIVAYMWERTA